MFHDESWKFIYFGAKRSKSQITKNIAGVGLYTLVSAGFFWFIFQISLQNGGQLGCH